MRHNLSVARSCAGPKPGVWAVVKANAYGHGLLNAVRGFEHADGLALIEFEMAAQLRAAGWSRPILMLEGPFDRFDVEQAVAQGLMLTVHDAAQIDWIARLSPPARLDVYLKVNSGMNRLGFVGPAVRRARERLAALPAVGAIGLMTHFADADLPGGADAALARFEATCAGMPGARSLANSAALIDLPATRGDLVRPGVMLYGGSPFAQRSAASLGLAAAMTLESKLIAVQRLQAGDTVGYGSIFRSERPMRIGVVACGYADGYPRHAPNGTPVLVDGVRTRTVGRVAMDMLMVDLTPVPAAGVGAPVELWGDGIPIDEVAAAAGTIGYELMCALAPRVPVKVID